MRLLNQKFIQRHSPGPEGIDPQRVRFLEKAPRQQYLAMYHEIDLCLDTFPYNGATTTLDTLWMGVPTIALRGERGISRSGYSIMQSLGASELIARDADEYVRLNVQLARDVTRRKELRSTLRRRLERSPLMDATAFVRDLEAGYRQMWRDWCRNPDRIIDS